MSRVSAFHLESHNPAKASAGSFCSKFHSRFLGTLLETKLIEINTFVFSNNMHMVPSGHMVWCSVQNRFWQN